jgi:hypothetical protein
VNEEEFLRSTSPRLGSETETSVAGQQCWRRLYREEASLPEGRRTVRVRSRSDWRLSEAITRCDYGCFGTLGAQSARTLVCSFRVELLLGLNEPGVRLAGRLVVGTKGTGSSPDLTVAREPERLSTPLPFGQTFSPSIVAGSSPCSRISTRRRRVVSGMRTYLIIRLGTSGREVGGGDGSDHGTSGNLRNSLESEGSRLPLRRSGVPGRDGPQWRAR